LLKIRTGYSFRAAAGKIDTVLDRLQEIGSIYAPITDRASTFGFYRWQKAALKRGLTPVFGVELAVSAAMHDKRPSVDHWTFIAQDDIEPLNRLVTLATTQFRYQPLITLEQALEAEGLFKMTGHCPPQALWELEPRDDVAVGLMPSTAVGVLKMAREKGWQLAASSDNRFARPADIGYYEVIAGRNANTNTFPQHILSPEEWRESLWHHNLDETTLTAAEALSQRWLAASAVELRKSSLPKFPVVKTLEQLCEEGAQKLNCDLSRPEYAARLAKELELIHTKEYDDYFYIVADICNWARERMAVGPARGSSCGSLVCYLLGITTVDPIPFGLIFERFVDINRSDMPDIDIDFSDQQRHQVFRYIEQKYGADHVARLGTVTMFQTRSAIGEIGMALNIPKWMCDALAESLPELSSGDSRAGTGIKIGLETSDIGKRIMDKFPEAFVMVDAEDHPRHYSQHAAGVVVSADPISRYVAVDHRSGATMCDKKDAEDGYNLLKIDCLGLTQLSVFEDALELAGLPHDHLETLPLDDPAAFQVLNEARWAGIFQFNGQALQSITKQFTVDKFDDIVSVTALGRPGPLASGGAHEWIKRRNGTNPVTYPHPIFEEHLSDTMGIVLYQEQVMEIGRKVGDLSWEQVTLLRKAMSKSLGKEYFDQFGNPWKKGAIAKGVDPKAADKIWDDLCAYGAWSFNKSHSVAYGLLSYWCCWLKAHYPMEFAAATLSHEDTAMRQIQLLREMKAEGYDYIPVDAKISDLKWKIGWKDGNKCLVGPLHNVKGIGPKMVSQILSARKRDEPLPDRAAKLLTNPTTDIDSLWPIRDGFQKHMPDPLARNIITPPTPIIEAQPTANEQEFMFFCTPTKINPRDENEVVNVARRGYEIKDGKTQSLNLQITDDTDTIFAKVTRWDWERLGRPIVDRGRPGKALYAIKGTMRANASFRMITVKAVRFIGELDKAASTVESHNASSSESNNTGID
jgi:DNA polymerase III alpha subunit